MKKTLLYSLGFALLFTSCSKDNSNNGNANAISCTIDGTNVTFNTNAKASRMDIGGAYSIQIIGSKGAAGSSDQIAIAITDMAPIAAGTYAENSNTSQVAGVNFIQAGNPVPYVSYNSDTNPSTVTITSIDGKTLKGSFKGDVYIIDGNGQTTSKKSITHGQLNVSF